VSHEPVAGYDLLSTFYDLAGGRNGLPMDVDGGSFRTLLENAGAGQVKRALPGIVHHRPNYAPLPVSTLRIGDMKLVVNCKTGEQELYDLAKDTGESKNIAAAMPEKASEMATILADYLKSVNAETYNAKAEANKKKKAKTRVR
jgi:arylsulfatase A-like enzyme